MQWKRSVLHVVLALSVAINVWLSHRVYGLQALVHGMTARPALVAGDSVPALSLRTADGKEVGIRYADLSTPTVLYILSPTCGWCVRNEESVRQLAQRLGDRVRFVGISLKADTEGSEPTGGSASPSMPFPIYMGLTDTAARQLRLRSTPTTVVISSNGFVLKIWEGAYTGKTKAEIEAHFGILLPEFSSSVGELP